MDDVIAIADALPQFCPDCGAGVESPGGPGLAMVARIPGDYHLRPPCAECARRDEIRMRAAGARAAYDRERRMMEAAFGALDADGGS